MPNDLFYKYIRLLQLCKLQGPGHPPGKEHMDVRTNSWQVSEIQKKTAPQDHSLRGSRQTVTYFPSAPPLWGGIWHGRHPGPSMVV